MALVTTLNTYAKSSFIKLYSGFPAENDKTGKQKTADAIRSLQMDIMTLERALVQTNYIGKHLFDENSMAGEEIEDKIDEIKRKIR